MGVVLVLAGVAGLAIVLDRKGESQAPAGVRAESAAPGQASAASEPAGAVAWERDLDSALRRAGSEKKLVMVDFYTDWCRWCRRLDETTLADAEVQKALGRIVAVKLDAERAGRSTAERFNVDGYPTLLFLSSAGAEVGRIPGYLEAGPFLQELNAIVRRS